VDILTRAERSALMSRIRAKDTGPELLVRRLAHRLGFRFRLHRRDLPGVPDLTFPRLRKVVFVHGCFWHRHRRCKLAYQPRTNAAFWESKFARNVVRDTHVQRKLRRQGWRVLVVWECQLGDTARISSRLASHLRSANPTRTHS
jgi:DNA mismatch endonuclease (patch repair protein)